MGLAAAIRCKIPYSESDLLQGRRLHSKDIRAPNWPGPAAYKRQTDSEHFTYT